MDFSSWIYNLISINVKLHVIWFGMLDVQVYGLYILLTCQSYGMKWLRLMI